MTETKHMKFLQTVADEDVRHLEMKERTYGGSWKKRGGVGAFMMLARKWDRIENVLSKDILVLPERGEARHQYDIFDHIVADPSGADSTVLAEVRDLRRYLLLVEAEMVARGVVVIPPAHDCREEMRLVPRRVPADAGAVTGIPLDSVALEDLPHNASDLSDSNKHASLTPWVVNNRWRHEHEMQPGGPREMEFDTWWRAVAPGIWCLEPGLLMHGMPPSEVLGLYTEVVMCFNAPAWVLRMEDCPSEARDWFPRLRTEQTAHELHQLPEWQQALYAPSDKGEFRLWNEAWAASGE